VIATLDRETVVKATAWASVLFHATHKGDRSEATRARRELEQLGVSVRLRRADQRGGAA